MHPGLSDIAYSLCLVFLVVELRKVHKKVRCFPLLFIPFAISLFGA